MKYDPASLTLRVVYVSGMVYDYHDVPPGVYESMRRATSKGRFLNRHIKGHYPFEKVG
ncbi:KTSC domain-containing protein [Chitinophaga horti]|uniref:KTSC domain-containing protein n=2 Tax=Chitinophaga horti TaxID=2920382 RepID=A0ABY6J928_9BACT|nr:KTSC domain-containing protein [Chitinophaga horti]UYQ95995.1 KTSC domain-containing protein [Chitinophaga horti]